MDPNNRVSIEITPEDETAIRDAIAVLAERFEPYLVDIDAQERRKLPAMGDNRVAFVTDSLEYVTQHPELAPQYLVIDEFGKDVYAVKKLFSLYSALQPIMDKLSDTMLIAGSEAFVAALSFYAAVQGAAKRNIPNADVIYKELRPRFAVSRKNSSNPDGN